MINLKALKPTKVNDCRVQLTEEQNRIKELESENARLRQQRDSANAQLDFLMEEVKTRSED